MYRCYPYLYLYAYRYQAIPIHIRTHIPIHEPPIHIPTLRLLRIPKPVSIPKPLLAPKPIPRPRPIPLPGYTYTHACS